MIISRKWLEEYIDIPCSDKELIDKLTFSGTLVDSYHKTLDDNIIVAEISEISPHPNADKLRLVKVSDGDTSYNIVCGASNIDVGQKVPLAKAGAKIGDVVIAETSIRGEISQGMICSEYELGLGDDKSGILVLGSENQPGVSLTQLYPSVLVMDLEITPNRGDCLSHLGVAREVASVLGKSIAKPPITLDMSNDKSAEKLSIEVKDKDLCPKYFARVIHDVVVAPSPEWLKNKLLLMGLKPVNNIVDITNYIMLDLGQPLHAFDATKIAGDKIIVRKAKSNEEITTLDGEKRPLKTLNLVIADKDKPIAIAGVMGGLESEITSSTKNIVLEAAQFNRISVRRTSKGMGISSEASYRFERGVDPGLIEYAINKAAKIINEIAGGKILSGIVKSEIASPQISVEYTSENINGLLGTVLSEEQIATYLRLLGFGLKDSKAMPPSWRHDISIWQDLAEEVVRLYGLDNIKLLPVATTQAPKKSSYYFKEYLKDLLCGLGFSEVYNYSFMSEKDTTTLSLNKSNLLEVTNPVSPDIKYMRDSLIPGILRTVAKNPTHDSVLVYEIGNTFSRQSESPKLCVASSGSGAEKAIEEVDRNLRPLLGYKEKILVMEREDLKIYKIKKPVVFYLEVSLQNIEKTMKIKQDRLKLSTNKKNIIYRPVSKYPSVTRDLAFIVNKDIKSDEIEAEMYNVSPLINNVELFDEFTSDKFGKNKKNLAFHLYFQAPDKTLNDDKANHLIKDIIKKIENDFKAKFRDK